MGAALSAASPSDATTAASGATRPPLRETVDVELERRRVAREEALQREEEEEWLREAARTGTEGPARRGMRAVTHKIRAATTAVYNFEVSAILHLCLNRAAAYNSPAPPLALR